MTHIQIFFPYPNSPKGARLRGINGKINELTFSIQHRSDSLQKDTQFPYLYELLWTIWLHHSVAKNNNATEKNQDYQLFYDNIEFMLPLSLKSIALRCLKTNTMPGIVKSIVFDSNHMLILEPIVVTIAQEFVKQVHAHGTAVDLAINKVLIKSDAMADFFNGLLALVHPAQISWLISRYFDILRACEDDQEISMENTFETLAVIRVSRQLRLRAAEKLASIPRFIALNFPYKHKPHKWEGSDNPCSWTNQMLDVHESGDILSITADGTERIPRSNWLGEILLNECFAICSQSCETIVNKSLSQVKSTSSSLKKSAMRKRIKAPTEDMAHYRSMGYHSISIVYDLILRGHATDSRYQTEEARSRIAGIFVAPVLENTLLSFQTLSRLEAGDKIRNIWLLCILYILQEAPEVALRRQFHLMCKEKVRFCNLPQSL